MKRFKFQGFLAVLLIVLPTTGAVLVNITSANDQAQAALDTAREEAHRANNIGVALLEQFKYTEAAEAFKQAAQLQPKLALPRINLGIALFNVPDLPAAQRELQAASALAPSAPQPHYVLGLIARVQNRPEDAIAAFQRVLRIDPHDVGTNINLGQIYAQQRRYPEAIAALRTALTAESYNATALYNLGTALLRSGQRNEGQAVIRRFQELRERGSGTTLGTNYLEQGRYAEAISSTGAEAELVDRATPAVTFTDATVEILGKVTAVRGTASALFGRHLQSAEVNAADRLELASALGGNASFFDFDVDGDLDLFWTSPAEQYLYRNDGGKFSDITSQSGAVGGKVPGAVGAAAGDYDNDSRPDLFVIRNGSLSLYRNEGGKFSDVSASAGLPAYPYLPSSLAFVDVDHDGDLDVFIAGLAELSRIRQDPGPTVFPNDFRAAPNLLLRNNGNGKFADITGVSRLDTVGHSVAVVPTDFNNKRDVDLMVVNYDRSPDLFSNMRDGSFRNVASETGLGDASTGTCAAAGDVNKDGYTDFLFGRAAGPALLAISDGQEKFKSSVFRNGSEALRAAQFLDYDNDGLLDCLTLTEKGLRVWRNLGSDWSDVSERAVSKDVADLSRAGNGRLFASADIDLDGDVDLVYLSAAGELRVARNDGGNSNYSLKINLDGRVSNRGGVGAKIEVRAGSLAQKLETYSAYPAPGPADIIFGLGKRTTADVVRVLWPAGIVQAETDIVKSLAGGPSATQTTPGRLRLSVKELDRKPSSCPYLYVWNGERFEFVTDFMGGGEMGHLEAPGSYNMPDPDEYVRIRGDLLKERNGRYELRVTNELEEAIFVDQLQLVAVAHPEDVEVYPREGLTGPPFRPFKLYATRGARPPIEAVDEHGHDVLSRLAHIDRQYPDDFRLHKIRGYADEHTLTLKLLDEGSKDQGSKVQSPKSKVPASNLARTSPRIVLLLTGWTDYAWSSDNLAASQGGKSLKLPALQVKDARGLWRTVIENIGIPVGRPQTVTVDLTGKFLTASREVRIVTNMRIYWDQILVDTSGGNFPRQLTRLDPLVADLRWRGFSQEHSPEGLQPLSYNYDKVSFTSPWKVMTGRYTREGDVRELLLRSDDIFVISRPGDELAVSFSATHLPRLPQGWTRTFLLYADGFSKEMDINSASPDQVGPLPFHGMGRYPYTWPKRYPLTEERRRYLEQYNTRVVTSPVPLIVLESFRR